MTRRRPAVLGAPRVARTWPSTCAGPVCWWRRTVPHRVLQHARARRPRTGRRAPRPRAGHEPPPGRGRAGPARRALLLVAAQQWAEVREGPLTATLVARRRPVACRRWRCSTPPGGGGRLVPADDRHRGADPRRPGGADQALTEVRPSLVAVVLDDESTALATALYLHRTIDDPTVPVVVRTRGGGTGRVGPRGRRGGRPTLPGPAAVPMLDRTCSPDLVDGGVREQLARALYEDHLVRAAARGVVDPAWSAPTTSGRRLVRPPTGSPTRWRRTASSRGRSATEPTIAFTPEETRRLAERDHDRWRARRGSDGWRYGTVRDALREGDAAVPTEGRGRSGTSTTSPGSRRSPRSSPASGSRWAA